MIRIIIFLSRIIVLYAGIMDPAKRATKSFRSEWGILFEFKRWSLKLWKTSYQLQRRMVCCGNVISELGGICDEVALFLLKYYDDILGIWWVIMNRVGTGAFPGGKRMGRGADVPSSSDTEFKETVELYLWPILACSRVKFTFTFTFTFTVKDRRVSMHCED